MCIVYLSKEREKTGLSPHRQLLINDHLEKNWVSKRVIQLLFDEHFKSRPCTITPSAFFHSFLSCIDSLDPTEEYVGCKQTTIFSRYLKTRSVCEDKNGVNGCQ